MKVDIRGSLSWIPRIYNVRWELFFIFIFILLLILVSVQKIIIIWKNNVSNRDTFESLTTSDLNNIHQSWKQNLGLHMSSRFTYSIYICWINDWIAYKFIGTFNYSLTFSELYVDITNTFLIMEKYLGTYPESFIVLSYFHNVFL